ncbi:Hypothetical protein FKW44_004495, partial [Caligus rogercresseyi]
QKICPGGNDMEMLDKNDPKTSDPVPIISLNNVAQMESSEIDINGDIESDGRPADEMDCV